MGKLIDLTGRKFGRLTVISRALTGTTKPQWRCVCACDGKERIVWGDSLRNGSTKGCGCLQNNGTGAKARKLNLIGKKFGKLTVISEAPNIPSGQHTRTQWLCLCDCGKQKIIRTGNLRNGHVSSCGCWHWLAISLPPGEGSFRALYANYKLGAKERKLPFELTHEEFKILTSSPCFYCGCLPATVHNRARKISGSYTYNGLDRRNNSEGYTKTNSIPCCALHNRMKSVLSEKEFIAACKSVTEYQTQKVGRTTNAAHTFCAELKTS
jgi:hypothetical protein